MSNLLKNIKKPLAFMLSAAVGCFVFALLFAEPFLWLTSPSSDAPSQSFCLTIDVSGSMAGSKMDEVKRAAKQFVESRLRPKTDLTNLSDEDNNNSKVKANQSNDSIALVVFSSVGNVLVPLTNDADKLNKKIDQLLAYGGTNFEDAIQKSSDVLPRYKKHSIVLLFTDGAPSEGDPQKAADIAYNMRKNGAQVISISTKDGDKQFLHYLTGSEDLVINADDGKIEDAFKEAETKIKPPSLTGSGGNPYVQSSGWAFFLCAGIALALVAAQNRFLRKPLLPPKQLKFVLLGSLVTGFVAGIIGETFNQLFQQFTTNNSYTQLGQFVGWTLLGAALAFGMTYFIPNLSKTKSLLFGALGGLLGAVAFVLISFGSPLCGRLLGAFILGACIGLLVSLVEAIFTKAWLLVMFDLHNITRVNLGQQDITVGSLHTNLVIIPDAPPKAGTFHIEDNKIHYEGIGIKRKLKPGEKIKVGGAEILVCSKESVFAATKFYPMRKTRIPQ